VVEEPRTEMFLPHAQFPREVGYAPPAMTIVVRADAQPLALLPAVRAQVAALDPALPVSDVRTMESVAAAALAQPRFLALLLGAFAALALTLAAVGTYGVIGYLAARRTHEIGVRMALGARGEAVLRMVLGEAVALGAAGVAAGVLGAALLTRLLASQLYAVRALDPLTFVAVPALLLGVALLAAWLPARRAAATQPGVALRAD
jgi:putative ABC transport system permease protein